MRLPRLLLQDVDLTAGQSVSAAPDRLHYATQVLRLKQNAACRVFDGHGREFHARLEILGRRAGVFHLGESAAEPTTPRLAIHLLQGIARGDHMDLALQKATELGVSVIHPVLCERSRSAGTHKGLEKRHLHWLGVLQAAAEQCGRNELPELTAARMLPDTLDTDAPGLSLIADEQGSALSDVLETTRPAAGDPIRVLIGPEGGLTMNEREQALAAGFQPVRTGPRTLRTETATIALITLLQWQLGDLDGLGSAAGNLQGSHTR